MNSPQLSSKEEKENKRLEAVRALFGEPVFIGLSEYVLKLRRNLVALSTFIIFFKWAEIPTINLFGLNCEHIDHGKIDIFLGTYLLYSAAYFFYEFWETCLRWGIRLTGACELQKLRTSDAKVVDITSEPEISDIIKLKDIGYGHGEQSYLYSIIAQIIYANSSNLQGKAKSGAAYFSKDENFKSSNLPTVYEKEALEAREAILNTIKIGLERFQKGFNNFQKVQVIKFFLFDIFIPILLTLCALILLLIAK